MARGEAPRGDSFIASSMGSSPAARGDSTVTGARPAQDGGVRNVPMHARCAGKCARSNRWTHRLRSVARRGVAATSAMTRQRQAGLRQHKIQASEHDLTSKMLCRGATRTSMGTPRRRRRQHGLLFLQCLQRARACRTNESTTTFESARRERIAVLTGRTERARRAGARRWCTRRRRARRQRARRRRARRRRQLPLHLQLPLLRLERLLALLRVRPQAQLRQRPREARRRRRLLNGTSALSTAYGALGGRRSARAAYAAAHVAADGGWRRWGPCRALRGALVARGHARAVRLAPLVRAATRHSQRRQHL